MSFLPTPKKNSEFKPGSSHQRTWFEGLDKHRSKNERTYSLTGFETVPYFVSSVDTFYRFFFRKKNILPVESGCNKEAHFFRISRITIKKVG